MVGDRFSFQYRRYYTYIEPILADPMVRSYFSLIASFFLIAFLIFAALSPTINTIIGLQKKISDQREILAALKQKNTELLAASLNYSQVENQIPLLDTALTRSPIPAKVIFDVDATASEAGVSLSNLAFRPIQLTTASNSAVSARDFSNLDFTFSVKGPSANVRRFLGDLENWLEYIRMKSITVSFSNSGPDIIVDVAATDYYLQ